jgi:hypothetical protein
MTARPVKITFAQMRNSGVRGILVYCSDYKCSHSLAISGGTVGMRLANVMPSISRSARKEYAVVGGNP